MTVTSVKQRIEGYAQKVLEDRLYFFTDADVHYDNWPKLLLGDVSTLEKVMEDSDFKIACRKLVEAMYKHSEKFLTFTVDRADIYNGIVVTLPEKEEEAKEALRKLNYEIKD